MSAPITPFPSPAGAYLFSAQASPAPTLTSCLSTYGPLKPLPQARQAVMTDSEQQQQQQHQQPLWARRRRDATAAAAPHLLVSRRSRDFFSLSSDDESDATYRPPAAPTTATTTPPGGEPVRLSAMGATIGTATDAHEWLAATGALEESARTPWKLQQQQLQQLRQQPSLSPQFVATPNNGSFANNNNSDNTTVSVLGLSHRGELPLSGSLITVSSAVAVNDRPTFGEGGYDRNSALVALFAEALMFLPLEDIESARRATPLLAAAADRVAPTPLGTPDVVFVRYEPQPIRTTLPATKAQKVAMAQGHNVPAMFNWQCLACGTRTAGPRYCRACRTPMAEGACRVFLGQLRKELTAELVVAMLGVLLPDIDLLHVESHTSGSDGHGRGCAWVFVGNVEDARRVTTLHKRILVDVDAEGGEGFWFARDWKLAPGVEAMAAARSAAADRPAGLPRLPMVAEAPARSMLRQVLFNRASAFG